MVKWKRRSTGPLAIAVFVTFLFCVAFFPASSRTWKSTPDKLAVEYAVISDTRPSGDLVLLMWFAPPIVRPDAPNAAQVRALLDEYIFLAAAHGHLDRATGTISFENIDTLEARDAAGKPLASVERSSMAPTTVGAVAIIERLFQQAFGAMGRGMKMFVFKPDDVHACEKGELSVPFVDENYTWETPIPGCS